MALNNSDALKWLQACTVTQTIQVAIDGGPAQTAALAARLAALPARLAASQSAQAALKAALIAGGASDADLAAVAS